MKLEVRWQGNLYTIVDQEVEDPDGKPIVRDNMWDAGWLLVDRRYDGDATAFVLDLHAGPIQRYIETGVPFYGAHALWNVGVASKPASHADVEDPERYVAINIHLGKGAEGARRMQALKTLAAEAGYFWNGEPSIGRWLSALADEKLAAGSAPEAQHDATANIRALAQEQLRIAQAIIDALG